jgi:hypothetical protein
MGVIIDLVLPIDPVLLTSLAWSIGAHRPATSNAAHDDRDQQYPMHGINPVQSPALAKRRGNQFLTFDRHHGPMRMLVLISVAATAALLLWLACALVGDSDPRRHPMQS